MIIALGSQGCDRETGKARPAACAVDVFPCLCERVQLLVQWHMTIHVGDHHGIAAACILSRFLFTPDTLRHDSGKDCQPVSVHAAVLESQAFGRYQVQGDANQAQPSGAKSEAPGHIGGVQMDAATPAGHAMQQATHSEAGGPGEAQDLKTIITDWLDKSFLPAINAQVVLQDKPGRRTSICSCCAFVANTC